MKTLALSFCFLHGFIVGALVGVCFTDGPTGMRLAAIVTNVLCIGLWQSYYNAHE